MSDKKNNSTGPNTETSNAQQTVAVDSVPLMFTPTAKELENSLLKSLLKALQDHEQVQRLSFESDPNLDASGGAGGYASIYKPKINLVPDAIIKRIAGSQGDDLVCQILQARSNVMASFGRPRTSRFAIGFEFVESGIPIPDDPDVREDLKKRIEYAKEFLWHCGEVSPLNYEYFRPNLSQFLKMVTRDAVAHGRLACERMYVMDPETGKERFVAFRPVDAGTIYYIVPKHEHDQSTRLEAIKLLESLNNTKIDIERYERDEYKYVQVINAKPVQTFSEKELVVYNFYPTNTIEHNGYPLTPIDQALNAIITHINITLHNKLYFQHGRAARGILTFRSDTLDEKTLHTIRSQFHQSINSVQNSWRTPIIKIGTTEELVWQPIDTTHRDQEFTYLMDQNARVILSAFQMSPEELPGYAHLARGTNTQALAEADNEWKLIAARDVGLRPLIYDMQDFFNTHIIPEIDPVLAKYYKLTFAGLEQDSPEKEATRISQDMPLHMTYNDVLSRVEKDLIDKKLGGDVPLNPQFHQLVLAPFLSVGEILENFMGRKGASQDPRYAYHRDAFWFQWQNFLLQKAQLALQLQALQQQAQAQQQSPELNPELQKSLKDLNLEPVNYNLLAKSENNHTELTKEILNKHKALVEFHLNKIKEDSAAALRQIFSEIDEQVKDTELLTDLDIENLDKMIEDLEAKINNSNKSDDNK